MHTTLLLKYESDIPDESEHSRYFHIVVPVPYSLNGTQGKANRQGALCPGAEAKVNVVPVPYSCLWLGHRRRPWGQSNVDTCATFC